MLRWIGAGLLAATVIFGGSPAVSSAIAAEASSAMRPADAAAIGAGAQRRIHHQRYTYRPYYPYYLGRPFYYSPGPFFLPDRPSWARGWDQWWW
jgi:hypothetical protein